MKLVLEKFLENITLTSTQKEDAKTKYTGICKALYHFYYDEHSYDDEKKYLFGSYKTKTNVRPLTEDQDVDVLFKIPQATFDKFDAYESNGQEALLQEVRDVLSKTYTTTDTIKAWGKVVLVKFAENHHNVEILPALEQEDNTFLIPNSENGGTWETFDPRAEICKFNKSNEDTLGLTRDLCKALKTWARHTTTLEYSSYEIVNDAIEYLDDIYPNGANDETLDVILSGFFTYVYSRLSEDDSKYSHFETAKKRADNALEYANSGKKVKASEEWRKVFGDVFPLVDTDDERCVDKVVPFYDAPRPWGII